MTSQTIKITGMHCTSCVKLIENSISTIPGVIQIKVDLDKQLATVEYDPNIINIDSICQKITELGYQSTI